jgi:hypothetical protein
VKGDSEENYLTFGEYNSVVLFALAKSFNVMASLFIPVFARHAFYPTMPTNPVVLPAL